LSFGNASYDAGQSKKQLKRSGNSSASFPSDHIATAAQEGSLCGAAFSTPDERHGTVGIHLQEPRDLGGELDVRHFDAKLHFSM
jgi:hypothetical protein